MENQEGGCYRMGLDSVGSFGMAVKRLVESRSINKTCAPCSHVVIPTNNTDINIFTLNLFWEWGIEKRKLYSRVLSVLFPSDISLFKCFL